jgi:hypothetical protein
MAYWVKKYADGKILRATDTAVGKGQLSWRYTSLDNMVGAELRQDDILLSIFGPGEYWHSDTFESVFPGPGTQMVARRIEKKINQDDKFFKDNNNTANGIYAIEFSNNAAPGKWVAIPPSQVGKWLILEYNIRTKRCKWYLKDGRI